MDFDDMNVPVVITLTDGYGTYSVSDNDVRGDAVWVDLFPLFFRLLKAKGYGFKDGVEEEILSFVEDNSGTI